VTVIFLTRYLGAGALLAVGLDHLEQRTTAHYSAIPTIGTLFLLNFVSATVVAVGLALPLERLGGPVGRRLLTLLALSGIGIAAGSIAGLLISESTGLFGFMETGYRSAIVLSLVFEGATIILLGIYLAYSVIGPRLRKPSLAQRRHADVVRPKDDSFAHAQTRDA
jgi:hypothetical protein